MHVNVRNRILPLAAALLVSCAAQKPVPTEVVWQRLDGTPATRDELERAAAACRGETRQGGGEGGPRFGHVEWAINMLDCMKRKGYERVEKPISAAATSASP